MSKRTPAKIHRFRRALPAALVGLAGLAATAANAAETMTLYYYERPPYSVTAPDGTPSGLIIDPTRAALERAGIPYVFQVTSINRTLERVREDPNGACSPGWYWTESRTHFAKFTKAIYHETPPVGVVSKSLGLAPGTRVADLLAGETRLVVNDGFVYGHYLDPLIARKDPAQIIHLPHPLRGAIDMVLAGHADLALVNEPDALAYVAEAAGGANLAIIHFPDIPAGDARYIICSRNVPDDVIDRLNRAIDQRHSGTE